MPASDSLIPGSEIHRRNPRLKICCIQNEQEASLALEAGADALGLVSAMPSGPGVISSARIAALVRFIGPRAHSVLLTSRTDVRRLIRQIESARPTAVQLCDRIEPGVLDVCRTHFPRVLFFQVVHVRGSASIAEAAAASADMLLLDSGRPDGREKSLGGTGETHDWNISRRIRDSVEVPVWLAGGLTPDNVSDALARVRPYGIDVCSGVRTHGRLDPAKLHAFVKATKALRSDGDTNLS